MSNEKKYEIFSKEYGQKVCRANIKKKKIIINYSKLARPEKN